MGIWTKWAPLLVLAVLVASAVALKQTQGPLPVEPGQGQAAHAATAATLADASPIAPAGVAPKPGPRLPSMIDLGSKSCIPCKKMAPILDQLRVELAGEVDVVFVDVGEDKASAQIYQVRMIPTQVFLDATGNEVARHVGFMSKEEILGQLRALGFLLGANEGQ